MYDQGISFNRLSSLVVPQTCFIVLRLTFFRKTSYYYIILKNDEREAEEKKKACFRIATANRTSRNLNVWTENARPFYREGRLWYLEIGPIAHSFSRLAVDFLTTYPAYCPPLSPSFSSVGLHWFQKTAAPLMTPPLLLRSHIYSNHQLVISSRGSICRS